MWELYDELIDKIPDDIIVEDITVGLHWTVVTAGEYCGIAMTVKEGAPAKEIRGEKRGQSLKYLASLAKSWNFIEASIGVAAINAYYNNKETWAQVGESTWEFTRSENAFEGYRQAVKDKEVAVIGHFPHLENYLTEAKRISILERRPVEGDYPDSACEYILPEQDYVFITGSTLINKTLPRLLQLSHSAQIILVGPSTPMTPILFRYGVNEMSGFLVGDKESVADAVSMTWYRELFQCGERIRITKKIIE